MDFLASINFLDILLVIVILILSLFAAVKGLFKNIVLLILMVFAVIMSGILAQKVQLAYINSLIEDPATAYVVSFILVLVCAYLIIFGVMKVFMRNNKEKESLSNTLLAFFIALVRFGFIFAIACSTLNSFDSVKDNSLWENSILVKPLVKVGDYAFNTKIKMQETNFKDYVPKQVAGGD
ncbi:colicin V production family protein [Francisella philomiragia]|uniref:CvpA family protein n=1 Tax=Francisella philomiragia TaxID=28110 RepID=UPI0005A56222|nr:CvpA family protein [Francisella philomiragia]AJI54520.1 colicin V production family protein [Francisella philomiragia]MBK2253273.1 CvpA family protein [Francisella philomiragia]